MRVGFRFAPKRAELAAGTPDNHPHVTPRDTDGTTHLGRRGFAEELFTIRKPSSTCSRLENLSSSMYILLVVPECDLFSKTRSDLCSYYDSYRKNGIFGESTSGAFQKPPSFYTIRRGCRDFDISNFFQNFFRKFEHFQNFWKF